jgi:hypothetical protein
MKQLVLRFEQQDGKFLRHFGNYLPVGTVS